MIPFLLGVVNILAAGAGPFDAASISNLLAACIMFICALVQP